MNSNIKKIVTSLAAVVCVLSFAYGQQTRAISLNEAITLSLRNNNHLKFSQARIDEATAVLKQAKDNRLPDVKISGSYLRLNQPNVDLKLKLGSQGSGTGEGQTNSSATVDQAAYVMANASEPIFAGFRVKYGIESARYLQTAAELDAETERAEVIANTTVAYINLYKAKSAVDVVREHLKQTEQRVTELSNLERNGIIPRNDLLKAQLQQSNTELTLLDAQNNWKMANINMDLILGLPEETELLPDSGSFIQSADLRNYPEWESLALQNRKDKSALEYRKKAADTRVKAAKGEYFPSLAVTGGYVAAHIPNLLTITNAVNVGVGLSYSPSSLWKTGAKVAQAKAQLNEVAIDQELLSDAIRLQVAQAYQAYLSAQKKIEVYAKAEEQANENYRIVNNKYTNALANTSELLEADVARLQAKLNSAYAKADALAAYSRLRQEAGVLTNTTNNNNTNRND